MRVATILTALTSNRWPRRVFGAAFLIVVLGVLPVWTVSEQALTIDIKEPIETKCGSVSVDVASVRRLAQDSNMADRAADHWEGSVFLRSGKSGVWKVRTAVVAEWKVGPIRWNKRYCIVGAEGPFP